MKKLIISCLALFSMLISAEAQDSNLFNHMALGLTAGTPGVGLELAMPAGNYVQLRAGFTMMQRSLILLILIWILMA